MQQGAYYPNYYAQTSGQPQVVSVPMANQPMMFYQQPTSNASPSKHYESLKKRSPPRKYTSSSKRSRTSEKSSGHRDKEKSSSESNSHSNSSSSHTNGPKGKEKFFVCELCNITCPGIAAYDAHLAGKKHAFKKEHGESYDSRPRNKSEKQEHSSNKENLTSSHPPPYSIESSVGDSFLNSKITNLTPLTQHTQSMASLTQTIISALNGISGIQDAKITGSYERTTMIRNQTTVDITVLLKEKPTKEKLSEISSILEKKPNLAVTKSDGTSHLLINDPKSKVSCKLCITWLDVLKEEGLNRIEMVHAKLALKHLGWFSDHKSIPKLYPLIRIMKDFKERNSCWKNVSNWAVEVLCYAALKEVRFDGGIARGLRSIFEYISRGIFLPGGCGIPDPVRISTSNYHTLKDDVEREQSYRKIDLIANLKREERLEITKGAQDILCLIAFEEWEKIFQSSNANISNVSPESPPSPMIQQETVKKAPVLLFGAALPQ